MKVNNNYNCYNPKFGTYFGVNLQEKILLGKACNAFDNKQLEMITKIENDGLSTVLEISNKYKLIRKNNKKHLDIRKHLTVSDSYNNVVIDELKGVYRPTADDKKCYFYIDRFVKIFDEEYNLAEKIKKGCEQLKAIIEENV